MSDKERKSNTGSVALMHALTYLVVPISVQGQIYLYSTIMCVLIKRGSLGKMPKRKSSQKICLLSLVIFSFQYWAPYFDRLHLYLDQSSWIISRFYTLVNRASLTSVLHFVLYAWSSSIISSLLHNTTIICQFCVWRSFEASSWLWSKKDSLKEDEIAAPRKKQFFGWIEFEAASVVFAVPWDSGQALSRAISTRHRGGL